MVKKVSKERSVPSAPTDVSPRAVVAMLLLVVVVTTLGLVLYLNALEKVGPKIALNGGKVSGEISFTLLPSGNSREEQPSTSGEVFLTLIESK